MIASFAVTEQAALERDNFESRLAASEKEVGETKARLETITVDLTTSKQELVCAHDQLHKTKIQFQEENLKKSEENENLKRQMQAQVSGSLIEWLPELGLNCGIANDVDCRM